MADYMLFQPYGSRVGAVAMVLGMVNMGLAPAFMYYGAIDNLVFDKMPASAVRIRRENGEK